ncbi:LysE family translocator [Undibacterium sp. Tian12W]|uniref:LysE family translocator n=1 Tax=Undibacterium sp. Tian12W TaxID=3413054 RepID=UPI003BEFB136
MEWDLFFKAVLIGLSIAAPVGPIGLLCIQRTLAYGMRTGFVSGMGAACADAVYGAIGAFGMVAITDYFVALSTPLAIAGAVFLAWMGGKLLLSKAQLVDQDVANKQTAINTFLSIFMLTITNPMTIVSFIAVFASIAGPVAVHPSAAAFMVAGVFLGSALWWLILSGGVALIRKKISTTTMMRINRNGGCLLLGFAAWQIWGLRAGV